MESDILQQSIATYKKQLVEVDLALESVEEGTQKDELISLRDNLNELIDLTQENLNRIVNETNPNDEAQNSLDSEFALFMSEMEKEGAIETKTIESKTINLQEELKSLEGMKCRAPHEHQWGDTMYHNAIVCSIMPLNENQSFEEIEVKVMFINPTHEEMLPCPYLMDTDCKFTDDKCKYSHGEIVLFSSLQEYIEPDYDSLIIGSKVLAKQSNRLWGRATIRRLFKEKYLVKFDADQNELELELQDILPLFSDSDSKDEDDSVNESDSDGEDIINMSLINVPATQALGDWEQYTKGIGSKIMQKMGYVVGTGLGRCSDGRTEPVSAVVLPVGKSLDHCMHLREKAGGDKDLFSVERKLKRLQKRQEKQNIRAYEREKKKVNVFNFLNKTLSNKNNDETAAVSKSKHRLEIKKESSRSLNVASLKIDEDIKKMERELYKIRESLKRHSDINSQMHKTLKEKYKVKQNELQILKDKAINISHEQRSRSDKKKLTVF
ncbi:hypothetical protein ILUMI_01368 [Ignelater luminosus]|uniref:Zinc finger CCCH-type with G patch domain-containing protein n=1 Tax=Ignelater luminosus TaxID=2038154 RepID=A0A8K0DKE8_IGNLU|nr:hypothetical protein ILUMI_01368 [Ignelater luminosus]